MNDINKPKLSFYKLIARIISWVTICFLILPWVAPLYAFCRALREFFIHFWHDLKSFQDFYTAPFYKEFWTQPARLKNNKRNNN